MNILEATDGSTFLDAGVMTDDHFVLLYSQKRFLKI